MIVLEEYATPMLAFWFFANVPSTKRETIDVLPTEIEPISTTFPFTRMFVNDGGLAGSSASGADEDGSAAMSLGTAQFTAAKNFRKKKKKEQHGWGGLRRPRTR